MHGLLQDLRYAVRMLAKAPGFTAVAILTLALAIGANTATFSAINALLLNPYPFPESGRIVALDARHISGKNGGAGYRDFLDWHEQSTAFDEMAIAPWVGAYTLTGSGEPRRVVGGETTYGFFQVLKIQPARGRFLSANEDKPGAPRAVVLSYAAWERDFAGADNALGRTLLLDGEPFTIIGVMPRGFVFPGMQTCDFFTALRESPSNGRTQHQYNVVARLKAGVTLAEAQTNISVIAQRLAQQFPETNTGWGVTVLPLSDMLAAEARTPTLMLFAAAMFILLLACANLAGLLVARGSSRAKEMAVRSSLGAGRLQIMRQLLTESVLFSLGGGAAGLVFANWLMDVLRTAQKDSGLDSALRLDWTVLVFTIVVSLATGVVFGLAPAWYGSRANLNASLKGESSASSGTRARARFQSALIAGQMTLSVVLLITAGLLIRDLLAVLHMQTGVRIENVLTFSLNPPWTKYSSASQNVSLYENVIGSLKRIPGVEASAAVGTLPMTGGMTGGAFQVEGRPKAPDWVDTLVQYDSVTPDYFRTMGIALLRGRDFDQRDTAEATPVAIINDTLARQFFPDDDPIGHRFRDDYDGHWRTIVGIVGSIKSQRPMNPPVPGIYAPYPQKAWGTMSVVVRTMNDPSKVATSVRGAVRGVDPDLLILQLRTMKEVVADSMAQPELLASFVACFGIFALILASVGVYGMLAYGVNQRIREIGIRLALGASRGEILTLIVKRGAILVGAGMALGITVALAASRVMGSLLFAVSPRDLVAFTVAPLVLVIVALAACYVPARRAASVDPNVALRHE